MAEPTVAIQLRASPEDLEILQRLETHYRVTRSEAIRMAARELARQLGLIATLPETTALGAVPLVRTGT